MSKKLKATVPPVEPTAPKSPEQKTQELQRIFVPIDALEPNDLNPNEMGDSEFNMLYDNIERMGVTDPILVRPHYTEPGRYCIVGGHHRWEVAKLHGFAEVPVTVVVAEDFDEDLEKFQMVRHNVIHGSMSPQKFMKLYESMGGKYSQEAAAEMFGFVDEEEFRKLVQSTVKTLPKEMQAEFKQAAKEIKTIEDLSQLLNRMFTAHGDTLPYNYMIFDYGSQDHIWLRMQKSQKKDFETFAELCVTLSITLDAAITCVLQLLAKGELTTESLGAALGALPKVELHPLVTTPTEEFLGGFHL